MAGDGPTYPVGVISFAPESQSYKVDSALYEALLRNNGRNAADAERRLALLKEALPYLERHAPALYDKVHKEIHGGPATV